MFVRFEKELKSIQLIQFRYFKELNKFIFKFLKLISSIKVYTLQEFLYEPTDYYTYETNSMLVEYWGKIHWVDKSLAGKSR